MKRLGRRHDIPWRTLWNLKYRPPKDLFVGVFDKLKQAQIVEATRQIERIRNDIRIAELNGVDVKGLSDQAEALAAELEDCLGQRRDRKA